MSKNKPKKKVVEVKSNGPSRKVIAPTTSRTRTTSHASASKAPLLFGKQNYILIGVAAGLMALGFILMIGGNMPDPNTWDPDTIYSFRITVLAPMVILAGLVVGIVAIFKKNNPEPKEG